MRNYFEFNDYITLLRALIKENSKTPSLKTRIAQFANIQPSYLSQVLAGSAQLTPDHAYSVSRYFQMPPLEADFFLALVDLERASHPDFRRHISQKISSIRAEAQKQLLRISETSLNKMPPQFYDFYYASWGPAAVHVAVSIDKMQTEEALIQELGILPNELREILSKLERYKLIERKLNKWFPVSYSIHIEKGSPWLRFHAHNWRQKSLEKMQKDTSLSYTDLCSLSIEDERQFQIELNRMLKKFRTKVSASQGEVLCCLNLDFFRV